MATFVVRKTFLEVRSVECSERRARAMTDSILGFACRGNEAEEECSDSGSTAPGSALSWADCESPRSSGRSESPWAEPEERRTTLIVQGLPASFTRDQLLELIRARGFGELVDFAYVPVDFRTMARCGFGFANFTSADAARRFISELHGVVVDGASISASYSEKDQGLPDLIDRHRNSPLMHHALPEEYRPLLLSNGLPVPFPPPTKKIRLQNLMQQVRRRQRQGA